MSHLLFIGVDGGATKCKVRIEDDNGQLLGEACDGPANIRLSVPATWQSIERAIQAALKPVGISLMDSDCEFHVGMGLAGCESKVAYHAFTHYTHPFKTLHVMSDAYTACLGAHLGQDGAIIIAGTGTIGLQIQQGQMQRVAGWGFPHDDLGSGAWLGLEAMRLALQALDGRMPACVLTDAVHARFRGQDMVEWMDNANSTAYATLAPLVIQAAEAQDEFALDLLKQAAAAISKVADALVAKQSLGSAPLPCALLGGVSPFLQPWLSDNLRARVVERKASPEVGALYMVRHYLKEKQS